MRAKCPRARGRKGQGPQLALGNAVTTSFIIIHFIHISDFIEAAGNEIIGSLSFLIVIPALQITSLEFARSRKCVF